MPLFNLNNQNKSNSSTDLQQQSSQNLQVNPATNQNTAIQNNQSQSIQSLGGDKTLLKPMNVSQNNSQIKEYQKPLNIVEQKTPIAVNDVSLQLDQKINSLDKSDFGISNSDLKKNTEDLQNLNLENLFLQAIKREASDLHLSVGYKPFLRIDGELIPISNQILTAELLYKFSKQITAENQNIDIDKIHQADLSYAFQNRRFRVNVFKRMGTFSIVCRLIPSRIPSLDELGLPPQFKEFTNISSGLILVTGPTGSGKSTTIASIINEINRNQKKHIVTVEDPIEYLFPQGQSVINQREYGIDFESWPSALKSMLRQDPDVVLVGEMRDLDTISSAITVSETGHLVFATLHTNSASQSIDRIIDVFPEAQQSQIRSQLANVIVAIVSQRLVPLTNGGRKAVMELMISNPAVKAAIRENKTYQIDNMIQTGQSFGMVSLEKSLIELIRRGMITVDTAKETSIKPDELDLLLNQA